MIRLPLALLATAGVLFVAGIAGSSNALVLASVVAAAAMLVALVRVGNAEAAAAPAAPATAPTTTVDEPVDEPVVVIDLAGLEAEAEAAAPAKATTKARAPKSGKAAKATTAVLEDVDVTELLGRVQGLGPRRVETVAKAFGSTAALRAASKADLTAIDGIGPAIADRILAELG